MTTRAAATRERLLATGMQLFAECAYDELSIDEIAAAAGVSHGLLFHHFGSKRGFYLAGLERVAAQLDELAEVDDPALPLRDRAIANIGARVDFIAARATGYRMLTSGGIGADPQAQAIVARTREAAIDRLLVQLGLGEDVRVREAAFGWSGMFERMLLRWLEDAALSRDELVELLADSLIAVIGAATR